MERHGSETQRRWKGLRKGMARAIANPAGEHGRMPRSTLSIGVGVSSSVSSGRCALSLPFPFPSSSFPLFPSFSRWKGGGGGGWFRPRHPSSALAPSHFVARSSALPPQPPTAVTGVGLAPNSYKIDGREPDRRREGFPRRSTSPASAVPPAGFPFGNQPAVPSIKEEERVARKNRGARTRGAGGRAAADEGATRRGLETRVTR